MFVTKHFVTVKRKSVLLQAYLELLCSITPIHRASFVTVVVLDIDE